MTSYEGKPIIKSDRGRTFVVVNYLLLRLYFNQDFSFPPYKPFHMPVLALLQVPGPFLPSVVIACKDGFEWLLSWCTLFSCSLLNSPLPNLRSFFHWCQTCAVFWSSPPPLPILYLFYPSDICLSHMCAQISLVGHLLLPEPGRTKQHGASLCHTLLKGV